MQTLARLAVVESIKWHARMLADSASTAHDMPMASVRHSRREMTRRTRSYTPYSGAIDGDTENDDDYVKTHPTHNDVGEKRTNSSEGVTGSRDARTDIVQVQAGLTEAGAARDERRVQVEKRRQ